MRLRKIYLATLVGLSIATGLSSCDPSGVDVNGDNTQHKVILPQTRGIVLNEGSMDKNNSFIEAFDYTNDTICNPRLFLEQNGKAIGDTGQDLIVSGNDLFLTVTGSGYIAKLDGFGLLEKEFDFNTMPKLGAPRYGVADGDYLYVTSQGGYVSKFKTSDLSFVDTVKVDANPEGIIVNGGKVYCVNSGQGAGNTMSVIDLNSFTLEESVTVCNDPVKIYGNTNGDIFILGYDENWNTVLYSYDKQAESVSEIGVASSVMVMGNKLYIANTTTDWATYATNTTFYTYDTITKATSNVSFLKNAPAGLSSATVYGLYVNQYTGDIYVTTTDYVTNGTIHHFGADGTYNSTFSSGGINPSKIIFMR